MRQVFAVSFYNEDSEAQRGHDCLVGSGAGGGARGEWVPTLHPTAPGMGGVTQSWRASQGYLAGPVLEFKAAGWLSWEILTVVCYSGAAIIVVPKTPCGFHY